MARPGWIGGVIGAALVLAAATARAQDERLTTIATAGHGGVYLPVGQAICQLLNRERERHRIRCLARPSAGSIENVAALRAGERDYAVIQSDLQDAALAGRRQLAGSGPLPELRALFSLHAEAFTVVVRPESGVDTFAEVAGRRLNVGLEGSGMRATAEDILAAFGLGAEDLSLVTDFDPGAQVEALCEGRIEVATFVVGHPSGYVQDATTACGGRLVPVEGPTVERLLASAPYYAPATIPGGIYPGQAEEVATLGVRATLVTLADRPENEVYELVRAVFADLELFRRLHPALRDLDPSDMATSGNTAPMHPGARRHFREAGLLE